MSTIVQNIKSDFLSKKYCKVLIVFRDSQKKLKEKGILNKVIDRFLQLQNYLDLTILWQSPIYSHKYGLNIIGYNSLFNLILLLLKITHNFDIVRSYDTGIYSFIVLIICKYIFKKKVIVSCHGSVRRLIYSSKIKKLLRIKLDKFVVRNSDYVITASESLREEYQILNPNCVFIPTWGVCSELFFKNDHKVSNSKFKDKILFVGRINPVKRIDFIIDVYLASKSKDSYFLYIIGPVDDYEYFKLKILNKIQKKDKIIFVEGLSQEELISYYKSSACLFMASYTEGLPHPVLEALSLGIPVLSSDVGDVKNIIVNGINGYRFPLTAKVADVAKLLDKICFEIKYIPTDLSVNLIYKNYSDKVSIQKEGLFLRNLCQKKM